MKRSVLKFATVGALLWVAVAAAQQQDNSNDQSSANSGAKMSGREMLNAAIAPLQQQVAAGLSAGVGALFNRLFSAMGVPLPPPAAADSSSNSSSGSQSSDQNSQAQASNNSAAAQASSPDASQAAAQNQSQAQTVTPSVVYALDRVDPSTFATIGAIDLSQGAAVLHTGDVFAIRYSTNLPGQVHIDNIDSAGATNSLGNFTVLAGRDNRIPKTKGFQLAGVTGAEQFKMYFYPCAAADPNGGTGNAAASLPPCNQDTTAKLLKASKRLILAKSAVNLESPDPTIAVSAAQNYRPNDVTENDFALQHMPPK